MWMEVHIYSNVNAKSQAGNIWVKDIMTKQKRQSQKQSARELKNLCILPKNSEGLRFRRERTWLGVAYLWEYMQKVAATLLSASRKGAVGA